MQARPQGQIGTTMNRAVSSDHEGFDQNLRAAAREAARREGLSLGEWLDAVVVRHAADLGVEPNALRADECVDAVSLRLDELDRQRQAARPVAIDEKIRDWRRSERGAPIRAATSPRPQTRAAPAPAGDHALRAWADDREGPPSPRAGRGNAAESAEAAIGFGRMAKRDVSAAPARTPPAPPIPDESEDLDAVEAKLSALFKALDRGRPAGAAESRAAASATTEATLKAGVSTRTLGQAIAEIAQRQDALDRAGAPSKPVRASERPAAPGFRTAVPRVRPEAPPALRPEPPAPPAAPAANLLGELQEEITRLAGRIDLVHQDIARRGDPTDLPDLAPLRDDMAVITRSLGDLAPKDSITSLETAVRDLGTRLAAASPDGMRDAVLAPLERLSRDIQQSLKDNDQRSVVTSLDREMRALGRKMDTMGNQGGDPESLSRILDQTREVRDLLKSAAARPAQSDQVEREIARLSNRLDALAQAPQQGAGIDVEAAFGEIRSMLDRLRPGKALEGLEQRVEALAAKLDASTAARASAGSFEALTQRLDDVHASLASQIAAPTPVDVRPIEDMLRLLAGQIDGMRKQAPDARALEGLVRRLSDRFEESAAAAPDLHEQVAKLAGRIDRSDAGLAAIVSVERSLGDLMSQMEETREAALAAAETAARTAARDTLRAAMLDPSLPIGQASTAADSVGQELADMRASRDAADQRLQSMLSVLNQTLEKIVGRLAALDEPARPAGSRDHRADASAAIDLETPVARPSRRAPEAPPLQPAAAQRARVEEPRLDEADFPIEPGTDSLRTRPVRTSASAPSVQNKPAPDVKADPGQFIAAARRAAQAAAQEAMSRASTQATDKARSGRVADGSSFMARAQAYAAARRRPLLLSLAGVVLLLGAVQVARLSIGQPERTAANQEPSGAVQTGDPEGARQAARAEPASTKLLASATMPLSETTAAVPADPSPAASAAPGSDSAPAPVRSLPTLAMGPGANRAAARLAGGQDGTAAGIPAGLRDQADAGNAAAQYEIGLRLADGRGVARDLKGAADWFQKAAQAGVAPAAYRMGSLYEKGLGVPRDAVLSMQWYQKAADQGNVRAMHNLAVMSAEGAGGKSDYAKAALWFNKASQAGVRDSQFNLAILYARGLGIEQNLGQSYVWFAIAAQQGDTDAAKKRDEVAARLEAKALADAKAAAEAFRPATPVAAANEVASPPGGWDAVAPGKAGPNATKATGTGARVSSL